MKRVHLSTIDDVRRAAVALATFAVDGDRGRSTHDPVHEWITEGRRAQYERALAHGYAWAKAMPAGYSSCGDLAHWMLTMLGVRDERVVNRGDDGGVCGWAVGANLSRLVRSPWYVHASKHGMPALGDVLHVAPSDHVAVHVAPSDHVAVLLAMPDAAQWITADYGQPCGLRRVCQLRDVATGLQVRGRVLRGWVSLDRVYAARALVAPAIVPGTFDAPLDDNPYDDVTIPKGVDA